MIFSNNAKDEKIKKEEEEERKLRLCEYPIADLQKIWGNSGESFAYQK